MNNSIIAGIIFVFTYILIISEKTHRTTAAMFGAVVIVLFGEKYGFYSQKDALAYIDFNTIGLLLGMMIVVSVLGKTGFFEYLAIKSAKISGGNPWRLLLIFGIVTAFISMFLDNVTTILLVAPTSIVVSRKLEIDPIPCLISESLLSNVGGVATLVGDPPNVMIASATGFSFNDFIIRLFPVVFFVLFACILVIRIIFRKELKKNPKNIEALMEMDEREQIDDWDNLKKSLAVLGFTIFLFTLHDKINLNSSSVALIGATLTLLVCKSDPHEVLLEVEWPTLVFFAGLFVVVGAVDKVGILSTVALKIQSFSDSDIKLGVLLVIFLAAFLSSLVDNIPFTAAMIPIIKHMGDAGLNVNPLWWALALGVGFGGNGTPIGSSANVVTLGISEKYGYPISFGRWLRAGVPVMIVSIIIASVFLTVFPQYFT
ncbi:MAG: SLC13 family permease [Candidatus Hydrothermarchaeota archaeon]